VPSCAFDKLRFAAGEKSLRFTDLGEHDTSGKPQILRGAVQNAAMPSGHLKRNSWLTEEVSAVT
jgi:hypothetical protein